MVLFRKALKRFGDAGLTGEIVPAETFLVICYSHLARCFNELSDAGEPRRHLAAMAARQGAVHFFEADERYAGSDSPRCDITKSFSFLVGKLETEDPASVKLCERWREAGLLTAIVTRKQTTIVTRRARDLGVAEVHQNVIDKAAAITDLLARHGLPASAVCYVGDDVGDLPAMRLVGIPVAVADAVRDVRRAATYVTRLGGGRGAIREVCDLILTAHHRRT